MASEKEDHLENLVDSFRTLLDEALIVAIASDYNLKNPSAYKQAQRTLQDLAQGVLSEEASGFNPSGIPQVPEGEPQATYDELTVTSTTSASRQASQARITDNSSTDNSSCVSDLPTSKPRLTTFNEDSEENKLLLLQSMFADLKEFDVQYALKQANGDFQTALDDLLNVQYLQSTGQQMKGVDGFFEPESSRCKGKKKREGKRKVPSDGDQSSDGASFPSFASEARSQDEIDYIAERFSIRSDQVYPIYYKFQCSKAATVVELLNQYISYGIGSQDESGKGNAERLAKNYRHVPQKYMPAVVHVAGHIPQFADDIAALLNKHFSKQPKIKKMDLSYRLTPLPQADIEGGRDMTTLSQAGATPAVELVAKHSSMNNMNLEEAMSRANKFHQASRDAAASAVQMHRRGSSSPLYRQAASYYSDQAREQGRYAQTTTSAAADILVAKRSTRYCVDLHGVLVQDGVRIARQQVREWWGGLGESRAKKLRDDGGFTVITGLGRHSAGGVSRMRQAVAAALLQDGWELRVETGRFVVTGRR
ncbi:Smr domain protein [Metarhizium album ARSEF 1941]|uniref:Smr domain protein n=1 Tax=Metarhizium album (strain ARSEF 1941) TaxID=1081103 RepID=A0A0B2X021_METAS|nr:Smr domain protein [Metarhizium album ARSEF 1941]KHN99032.1 Smr domain protein [Metarhizium album ARSEF 1941]